MMATHMYEMATVYFYFPLQYLGSCTCSNNKYPHTKFRTVGVKFEKQIKISTRNAHTHTKKREKSEC